MREDGRIFYKTKKNKPELDLTVVFTRYPSSINLLIIHDAKYPVPPVTQTHPFSMVSIPYDSVLGLKETCWNDN